MALDLAGSLNFIPRISHSNWNYAISVAIVLRSN